MQYSKMHIKIVDGNSHQHLFCLREIGVRCKDISISPNLYFDVKEPLQLPTIKINKPSPLDKKLCKSNVDIAISYFLWSNAIL